MKQIVSLVLPGLTILLLPQFVSAQSLVYIHSDHLGSTALATDTSGRLVSKQNYYPYGTTRSASGSLSTEKQYTGQVSDTDSTGLYYYNARYYNPSLAKFTQADSALNGLNLYAYVKNNPSSLVDPTGREACVPWNPNCWKEAISHDFNGIRKFANNLASYWVNDPEGFTQKAAQTVLTVAPQVAAYWGAMYVAGPQVAEALDTTLCAFAGDPGMCAVAAQAAGPNVTNSLGRAIDDADSASNAPVLIDIGGGNASGYYQFPDLPPRTTVNIDIGAKPDVVADALNLPFASNSVDFACSSCLPADLLFEPSYYDEVSRVVKPGGSYIYRGASNQMDKTIIVPPEYMTWRLTESGFSDYRIMYTEQFQHVQTGYLADPWFNYGIIEQRRMELWAGKNVAQ